MRTDDDRVTYAGLLARSLTLLTESELLRQCDGLDN